MVVPDLAEKLRQEVVAERYAPGYHQNTRFVSWSMAKTITATMITTTMPMMSPLRDFFCWV